MRKITLLIIFFILQIFIVDLCVAQNQHKIDSLLNVLKTSKEDSAKVNTLNAVSRILWQTGDFVNSRKHAVDALQLAEKINFGRGKASAYRNIGVTYEDQGNYSEALNNFSAAINESEKNSDKKGIASGYLESGNVYYYQGDYAKALNAYMTELKIFKEINAVEGIAVAYGAIGGVYFEQGNYADALENILFELKLVEAMGNKHEIASCNINLAAIYERQNNLDSALKCIFTATKIMEETGDKRSIVDCYNNTGEIYKKKGNYSEALNYYLGALKIAEETGDKRNIAFSYRNLGNNYLELKNFSKAEKYLNDGLSLSKEIGAMEYVMKSYKSLAILDSAVGNYKQSFEHYKLYTVYKDSVFNETNGRQIEEMKTKYESGKKDDEIALLTKNKQIQNLEIKRQKFIKNSLIGGLVLLLLVSILFYNYYRTKQLLKLQTLRNRIASDLHDDVGSTLSSISIFSELAKEQSKEVIPMLENIGESSRKMLESMADIVWTINPENDNFEKIIFRMRSFAYELLGAKKIDFEFTADDAVSQMKLSMDVRKNLYLIFKEAINNMVKYAEADRAFFSISGTKTNLTMLIRDNGKGFDINQSSQGNGLRNMKKRAEEIGAKLMIESGTGIGTTIQFLLKTA